MTWEACCDRARRGKTLMGCAMVDECAQSSATTRDCRRRRNEPEIVRPRINGRVASRDWPWVARVALRRSDSQCVEVVSGSEGWCSFCAQSVTKRPEIRMWAPRRSEVKGFFIRLPRPDAKPRVWRSVDESLFSSSTFDGGEGGELAAKAPACRSCLSSRQGGRIVLLHCERRQCVDARPRFNSNRIDLTDAQAATYASIFVFDAC